MSKITKVDVTDDDVIKSQENGAKSNSTQESADSQPAEGGEGSSSGISSEDEEVGEDSEGESDDEEEGLVDLEDLGMILKIFNFSKDDFVHKKYIKKRTPYLNVFFSSFLSQIRIVNYNTVLIQQRIGYHCCL